MDTIKVENDITVLCVTATSFPEGISEAHEKLHNLLPTSEDRNFYGISCPNEQGVIVYKAAAEQLHDGEAKQLKCETFIIKKGDYISSTINYFHKDMGSIGKAFHELLSDSRIDPEGCCVEVYLNQDDVQCLIRLDT